MPRSAKEKPEIEFSVPETIELLNCTKKSMSFGGQGKMRVASCELQVASCELRVASCELQVAHCELLFASCTLRVPHCLRYCSIRVFLVINYTE